MTRIISGVAGSRKLASPAKATRPTSDRIRESIFNRLQARDWIDNKRVLDLYAGTGALALERQFAALAAENVNIKVITTSEIKISVLIDRKYMELAVQALHDAFELEKAG